MGFDLTLMVCCWVVLLEIYFGSVDWVIVG